MLIMILALGMSAAGPEAAPAAASGTPPVSTQTTPNQPDAVDRLLQQSLVDVRAGRNAEALAYLDPMASAVSEKIGKAQFPVYCPQSAAEAKTYLAFATPASPTVRLIQPRLCSILFMRAYVLENLNRLQEAIEQLRKLIVLAPDFPHFQAEYASALRQSGNLDAALVAYRRVVELASPVKEYAADEAAAWRGIGFVLTERNDLDGAEKAYRRSLELMPDHPIAINELAYIARLRATGMKAPARTTESSVNPRILPMPEKQLP